MKNNNNLIIENKVPIEIVQELKSEYHQTYEEFMRTYQADEKVSKSYENEFDSYECLEIKRTSYGPGNSVSSEKKATVKTVGGVALTTLTIICPPAGLAVGAGVATGGAAAVIGGTIEKDPETVIDGFDMFAIGMGSAVKGAIGSSSHKGYVCSLPICPKK